MQRRATFTGDNKWRYPKLIQAPAGRHIQHPERAALHTDLIQEVCVGEMNIGRDEKKGKVLEKWSQEREVRCCVRTQIEHRREHNLLLNRDIKWGSYGKVGKRLSNTKPFTHISSQWITDAACTCMNMDPVQSGTSTWFTWWRCHYSHAFVKLPACRFTIMYTVKTCWTHLWVSHYTTHRPGHFVLVYLSDAGKHYGVLMTEKRAV